MPNSNTDDRRLGAYWQWAVIFIFVGISASVSTAELEFFDGTHALLWDPSYILPLLAGWTALRYGRGGWPVLAICSLLTFISFGFTIRVVSLYLGYAPHSLITAVAVFLLLVTPAQRPFKAFFRTPLLWLALAILLADRGLKGELEFASDQERLFKASFSLYWTIPFFLVAFAGSIRWSKVKSEFSFPRHLSLGLISAPILLAVTAIGLCVRAHLGVGYFTLGFGASPSHDLLLAICFALVAFRLLDGRFVALLGFAGGGLCWLARRHWPEIDPSGDGMRLDFAALAAAFSEISVVAILSRTLHNFLFTRKVADLGGTQTLVGCSATLAIIFIWMPLTSGATFVTHSVVTQVGAVAFILGVILGGRALMAPAFFLSLGALSLQLFSQDALSPDPNLSRTLADSPTYFFSLVFAFATFGMLARRYDATLARREVRT